MDVPSCSGWAFHHFNYGDGHRGPDLEDRATAIVTDNLDYLESYQPFERPPDPVTLYSLIPRGLRRFFLATAISAKPINDQINVFITATLPPNFAYILSRFNLTVSGDRATDWEEDMGLRMLNHIPGQPLGTSEQVSVFAKFIAATGNPNRTATEVQQAISQFAGPFWATATGGSATFRVDMTNTEATAAAAAFVITHCEFLEYDLTQAQRYYVNTPYPVMQR